MSNVQCSVVGSRQPFTLHDRVAAAPSRWAHNLLKVMGMANFPEASQKCSSITSITWARTVLAPVVNPHMS